MTTKNVRVVGYLPPPDHEKLREYMREESLTESAAIIKIVKQFFDGSVETKTPDTAKEKDQAMVAERTAVGEASRREGIADLKADVVELKRRLAVLEQAVGAGLSRPFANSRTPQKQRPPMTLPPQSSNDLARRLGVSTGTLEQADEKGEAYFKDWSRRMDPTKKSWLRRGELFHPESD